MYIFGYGSLVNLTSAQKSFKRKLSHKDFIEVTVKGYEKVWNAIEYIHFENEDSFVNGVFLNLGQNETSQTNGVLLEITDEEFEFLKLREKNYSCIEIKNHDIIGFDAPSQVYTFMTTNSEKIAQPDDKNSFIPQNYIGLLEEGIKPYSQSFKEKFVTSYNSYPFAIKLGKYTFSDPIQNKFAKSGIGNEK